MSVQTLGGAVTLMPWQRIELPTNDEIRDFYRDFRKKARFLVDETLGESFVEALSELGWNATGVAELGIAGHSDEAIFSRAWQERRILLTQDRDFLDDRRFPPHRNPGVIILPDEPIESDVFARSVSLALDLVGDLAEFYRGCKLLIHRNREITEARRNRDTGAMERTRYRFGSGDDVFIWKS